jgi:hypothetical protein
MKLKNRGLIILALCLAGCHENNTPKPKGYFRIDFPEKRFTKAIAITALNTRFMP